MGRHVAAIHAAASGSRGLVAAQYWSMSRPSHVRYAASIFRRINLSSACPRVFGSPFPPINPTVEPIADFVTKRWSEFASDGRLACVDEFGNARNFSDMIEAVANIAGALQRTGVRKGDVVCLVSPNHVDYGSVALATMRLGAILTPANHAYTSHELVRQLQGSGAKAVIGHPSTMDVVLTAVASLDSVKAVACLGGEQDLGPAARTSGVLPVDLWRADGGGEPGVHESAVGISPDDIALLPFSSGTTGLPKGTQLTHRNLTSNLLQFMAPEGRFIADGSCVACPLPQFHIYAFTLAVLFMHRHGHPLVTMTRFDLEGFCELVQKHRPCRAYLVPPIILGLAKHPLVDRFDLSSLEMITSAAAPLDSELSKACSTRLGCGVKQAWGMSELSPLGTWPADDMLTEGRLGSVGPPVPNTSVRLVQLSGDGHLEPHGALLDVAHGEEGELIITGPQVMRGYLNMPEATARSLVRDEVGTTWLRTGDIARVDNDGFVYIVDRAKELIKYKGFQVAPAELEAVLYEHPHVLDAAVIPVPCEIAGEVPRAYVVVSDHAKEDTGGLAENIDLFVRDRVAPHKRLRGGVVVTDKIPKSASGKILRRVVKEQDLVKRQPGHS